MKKPVTTPRTHRKEVWYTSMLQWAGATGRPVSDAKRAKRDPFASKRFFRHSRVSAALAKWLDENPGSLQSIPKVSEKERLQAEKLLKENRALDFEHDLQMGKYEPIEKVKADLAAILEAIRNAILTFTDKATYNNIIREAKKHIKELDL